MKQFFTLKKVLVCLLAFTGINSFSQLVTTFDYTGDVQTFTVPPGGGLINIQIEVFGAQGADNEAANGGLGGYMSGTITATPGDIWNVYVGGMDGYNGGGAAGLGSLVPFQNGAVGGGASDVRIGGVTYDDRVIVAGGGGGGGRGNSPCSNHGGGGGYPGGLGGLSTTPGDAGFPGTVDAGGNSGAGSCEGACSCSPGGGGGGGGNGGGAAGNYGLALGGINTVGGTDGACGEGGSLFDGPGGTGSVGTGGCFGTGGDGGNYGNGGGAGGGGGWFGGGAGGGNYAAGGGGGSSYIDDALTDMAFENDMHAGNGQIIITLLCSPLTLDAPITTLCLGEEITLSATSENDGTVTWDMGIDNGIAFTPPVGTTIYTASSDDDSDCARPVTIIVNELPTVTLIADETTVCEGEEVTLAAGGATTYVFDPIEIEDRVSFTPEVGITTITVIGTDDNGCENSTAIDIAANALPTVTATANYDIICLGADLILTGGGASTYEWDMDVEDGVAFTQDTEGTVTYTVIGTDINSCEASASITVETVVNTLALSGTYTLDTGADDGEIDLTVTGGIPTLTFDWDNDETGDFDDTEDQTGLTAGTYNVVVRDEAGCEAIAEFVLESQAGIEDNELIALSVYPNPVNDLFTISLAETFSFKLIDLQGKIILNGTATDQKTLSIEHLAQGTYVLQVRNETGTSTVQIVKQ